MTASLIVPDLARRAELSGFVARVVMLDADAVVRLRAADGQVVVWATTPFDVLATRSVPGELHPADLTVAGHDLLAALAVARGEQLDPGRSVDDRWRTELPPASWAVAEDTVVAGDAPAGGDVPLAGDAPARGRTVAGRAVRTVAGRAVPVAGRAVPVAGGAVPAAELTALAEQTIAAANEQGGPSDELLDGTALTVGENVRVPARCLLALSGLGLLDAGDGDAAVRVSATDAWLRLDTPRGSVVRRRRALLPLVF